MARPALEPRTPAQIEKYLLDALKVIQRQALHSTDVDWDAVYAEARETAAQSRSYAGTHRLLNRVLKRAGGGHSHMALSYQLPGAVERGGAGGSTGAGVGAGGSTGTEAGTGAATGVGATAGASTRNGATTGAGTRTGASAGGGARTSTGARTGTGTPPATGPATPPLPQGKLFEGAAHLTLPGLSTRTGGLLLVRRYGVVGGRVVAELAAERPRGWIVDLRENTGGAMWPMIAAVAALLDRGVLGRFLLPDGRSQAWRLKRHYVSLDRKPMARVRGGAHRRDEAPLAILTSERTASAGEAALVALLSRPTPRRTFGTATAGMTTGNVTHFLPDGTRLMISVSHYADAGGKLINGPIQPDEPTDPSNDENTLKQALAWIDSEAS